MVDPVTKECRITDVDGNVVATWPAQVNGTYNCSLHFDAHADPKEQAAADANWILHFGAFMGVVLGIVALLAIVAKRMEKSWPKR